MSVRMALAAFVSLAGCAGVQPRPLADPGPGQRAWAAACEDFDEWDKAGPPFRVYGNTYYVGTCGISSLLITSPAGHALIDSGTDKGAEIVLANIRALGFDPHDVKVLLMSHEHFDHVGGMARLQAGTGAMVAATREAAAVLRRGAPGDDDPQAHSGHPSFPPVAGPIMELRSDEPVMAGGLELRPLRTPGHTPGALSWTWRSCERPACKAIVYADSLNPISSDDYRFSDHPALLEAFHEGIARLAAAPCDIVLAPHPGSAGMRERLLRSKPLVDPTGCRAYADGVTARLNKRLADEVAR